MSGIGRRASVAIEFAILAPVMLMLGGGMYVLGSLLHVNSTVNKLAMQYAVSFANCSDTSVGACGTELAQYETAPAIKNIFPQLYSAELTLTMAQAIMNGTTPTVEYPVGGTLTAAQTTAMQAVVASGQTGVVVTATYVFYPLVLQPLMAPFIGSSITVSYTVAQLK